MADKLADTRTEVKKNCFTEKIPIPFHLEVYKKNNEKEKEKRRQLLLPATDTLSCEKDTPVCGKSSGAFGIQQKGKKQRKKLKRKRKMGKSCQIVHNLLLAFALFSFFFSHGWLEGGSPEEQQATDNCAIYSYHNLTVWPRGTGQRTLIGWQRSDKRITRRNLKRRRSYFLSNYLNSPDAQGLFLWAD